MSFGRPPGLTSILVAPPDRGSFPLDHDGECKTFMKDYLTCLRTNKNKNGECRVQSKAYLECRMSRGLMERDDWKNLGFGDMTDSKDQPGTTTNTSGSTASTRSNTMSSSKPANS